MKLAWLYLVLGILTLRDNLIEALFAVCDIAAAYPWHLAVADTLVDVLVGLVALRRAS